MDSIFKALSDETRRMFLDQLRKRDGQTLSELESSTGLSRFGVMKHLKQLEAAKLIITRKDGRFKYHYLNAAPLQQLVDRWIEPLTQQPLARVMLDLKAELERNIPMTTAAITKPDYMLETFIRTTPEKLWEALTSAEMSKRYYIAGAAIHGSMMADTPYEYLTPNGAPILTGTVISADPPKRLEMTFLPGWMGPDAKQSRIAYEIEAIGSLTKLSILHFDIPSGQEGVKEGWAKIAASLKSLLETGEALNFG
jgi:DNA-binding transcriptional ArsR family regulator/uncharacterized protein YndB with AHSA1/START domain